MVGMTKNWEVVTVAAAVGCGTVGGVFFAFSGFVMSGLTRLPAAQGIAAMQSINVTATRPPLMLALFGSAALCVALIVRAITGWGDRTAALLLAGAVLYLAGAVLVTIAWNVPLNNHLASLPVQAPDAAGQWHSFVRGWTIANHVRAAASLAALACLAAALLAGRSAHPGAGRPAQPGASGSPGAYALMEPSKPRSLPNTRFTIGAKNSRSSESYAGSNDSWSYSSQKSTQSW
jgi:uncharacterized membrane protein